MTSRRSEAPPRGQKHDTRLVRFRKFLSLHLKPSTPTTPTLSPSASPASRRTFLHPKQVRLLKALDRWKAQNPGRKIVSVKLSSPQPPPNPSPVPSAPPLPGPKLPSALPPLPKVPEGETSSSSESNTASLLSMFPPEA